MVVSAMVARMSLLDRVFALPSVAYEDRHARLPDRPGLYFAIRADGEGREILYVGLSKKSIRRRWKGWHSATCAIDKRNLGDQVRIAYVVYDDTSRLVADERAALREFAPTFNYSHVPGAFERMKKRMAEECEYIGCKFHEHDRWPAVNPTTPWPGWSYFLD